MSAGAGPLSVSVLLVAGRAPGESLDRALGRERVAALRALLRARADRWARASFAGASVRAFHGGLGDALDALLSSEPAGRVGAAVDGHIVLVAPELAVWRPRVGEEALDDLRAGCALSFGPVFDGSLYLFALGPAALAPLRAATTLDLNGPAVLAGLVELAERSGLEVGMSRTERGLRRAEDVRALLADPLCDDELRRLLTA